jgi:hypothetical protein
VKLWFALSVIAALIVCVLALLVRHAARTDGQPSAVDGEWPAVFPGERRRSK